MSLSMPGSSLVAGDRAEDGSSEVTVIPQQYGDKCWLPAQSLAQMMDNLYTSFRDAPLRHNQCAQTCHHCYASLHQVRC